MCVSNICLTCAHSLNDMETCDKNMDKMSTRSGRKTGKRTVKIPSRESSPEESLSHSLSSITLEERERHVLAEIEAIELENRVAELEAERDRPLSSRRGLPTISSPA